ncbi:unnamed protein product [Pylaiella littoralis]
MGNNVGRHLEGAATHQPRRSVRENLQPNGGGEDDGASSGSGDDGERRTFRQTYMLEGRIGTGSHSQVFRAVERATGRGVAVKAIRTDTGSYLDRRNRRHLAFLQAEISVHQEVSRHPFVVDLLGVFEDPEACFIVEELARGGSLLDHLHSRTSMGTEGEVRSLLRRLLAALLFLHSRHIVHRDIKSVGSCKLQRLVAPENILVMEEGVMQSGKLGDFGFATRLEQQHTHPASPRPPMTAVGTPEYVAPEVLLQQPFDGKADVWSAGVTAFCLLSGAMPFRGLTLDKLYTAVLDGACSYAGPEWTGVSPRARDFVRRMLVVDPGERWTAEQLLGHPWLTDGEGAGEVAGGVNVDARLRSGVRRRAPVRLKALALAVVFLIRLTVRAKRGRGAGASALRQELELGGP